MVAFFVFSCTLDAASPLRKIVLTDKERAFIEAHPRIVLGTDRLWHPYIIITPDGNLTGYDADVLALVNKVSGANFTLKAGNWEEMQEEAREHIIDGLSTGAAISSRKSYLNFSDVYITVNKMVIAASNNPKQIHSLKDLNGKVIALHRGNLADEETAKAFKKSIIVHYDTVEEVLKAVASGEADAAFANGSTLFLANELGMPYFKRVATLPQKLELVFAVRKDWPEAISIINKSLKQIGKERLQALQRKWFWQDMAMPLVPEQLKLSNEQKRYLYREKKIIRYCIDPDWMPLEAIASGRETGMVSDLVTLFSERVGVPFVLIPTKSWEESLSFLERGKCDILPMIMATKLRARQYHFTTPYLQFPIMVATKYDKSFITDFHALSGKEIGVRRNYVFKELLEPLYPDIRFVEYDSEQKGLEDVRAGKLFGFIDNLYTLGYLIQRHFATQLKISGKLEEILALGIAISKKEPKLFPVMQQLVDSLEPDKLDRLTSAWLTVTYNKEMNYSFLWKVLAGVLLVGVFLFYRQYMLARYNRQLQDEVERKLEELRRKDELLVQKLRMAAMGEMLSMIAHQWRQPLSAINSTLMSIDLRLKLNHYDMSDPKEREIFFAFLEEKHRKVDEYTKFLSHTIDDFRHFFSPHKEKQLSPVTEPVKRAVTLMGDAFSSKGISVETDYRTEVSVRMFQNEVMQVVLNILKNCEDNFTSAQHLSPRIRIITDETEEEGQIVVCDNGGGIPEEILGKIFDPYFSTKEEQQGVGLGLYMSKVIIEKHHLGSMKVKNTKDGVCFIIVLPKR